MNELFPKDCIRTFTGQWVNVFDPKPETLLIEDLAHALANLCRFGGHCSEFYSVAQHSVLGAQMASKKNKLPTLLHDLAEGILIDVPSPIKRKLTNYCQTEDNMMMCLSKKFGFEYPLPKEVKEIDKIMLEKEWNSLMVKNTEYPQLECWKPAEAEERFLSMYYELQKSIGEILTATNT